MVRIVRFGFGEGIAMKTVCRAVCKQGGKRWRSKILRIGC